MHEAGLSGGVSPRVLERAELARLFHALAGRGYRIIGPTLRDGAIVYDDLAAPEQLPEGWADEQDGGRYRLKRRADGALFGHALGPHSWKRYLYPPQQRLFRARREGKRIDFHPEAPEVPRYALIGARACELEAILIQDRVFLGGPFPDPGYKARRERAFIVAVHCGQAGGTCFCVSMASGPKARAGFDLALAEVLQHGRHYFVVECGSARGAEALEPLALPEARPEELAAAARAIERAAGQMGRTLDTAGIKDLLYRNHDNPRWDGVAGRCLTCANCTLVCPTCFCTNVEDRTDLSGEHAERWRKWGSCFTLDFSHIAGGAVRASARSRYRQWLTHKLGTWLDQFGTSGCVGCGRCITWCPVAIDLTEEVRALRRLDAKRPRAPRAAGAQP
jgi:ferredoxin